MASPQMEDLKTVMRKMMVQGLMPQFDGTIDPAVLRQVVQGAQAHMDTEPGVAFETCELGGIEADLSEPEGAQSDASPGRHRGLYQRAHLKLR